ncbi:MAG: hypothetical protein ACLQVD_17605 [Capsulimonadaceae bacterium]
MYVSLIGGNRRSTKSVWPLLVVLTLAGGSVHPRAAAAPANAPAEDSGIGFSEPQGTYVELPDPKRPGKWLWKLWGEGLSGESRGGGLQATMSDVFAILYSKGIPSAILKAPTVHGDYASGVLVATGRVSFTAATAAYLSKVDRDLAETAGLPYPQSSQQRAGIVNQAEAMTAQNSWVKADKVTWYSRDNKGAGSGVATGNVVFHDGRSGAVARTPRLNFDGLLQRVESAGGVAGSVP